MSTQTPATLPKLSGLTPEQKRVMIARAAGLTEQQIWSYASPVKTVRYDVPDYLDDLNAMHLVEQTTLGEYWLLYCDELQIICVGPNMDVCATAAQRADAFLLTKQLATN